MAISKKRKEELVAEYTQWAQRSEAFFLTEYTGVNMKQMDELRAKIREAGGEFHVIKNTLSKVAFEKMGLPVSDEMLSSSTSAIFAYRDAAGLAKIVTEFSRTVDPVKVKGGYLNKALLSADQVKSLAELPPLPVIRAQLLGVISAPASKLVRTLAEPARSLAAVLKAYADRDAAQAV